MNIIHQPSKNEKKISWNLVFSGLVLKIHVHSGTHCFIIIILIQESIYNTWMQVGWGFRLNRDKWFL